MVNIELYELKNLLMEAAAMGAAMVQKPNDVMPAVSALNKRTINFNKN